MVIKHYISVFLLLLFFCACSKSSAEKGGGGDNPPEEPVSGNIRGKVLNTSGSPIEGVVVSDGLNCTKTNSRGEWGLTSDLAKTDYVFVSTPSLYSAPLENGTPVFWKFLSDLTPSGEQYLDVNFTLYKLSTPERFSIIIYADPQPRKTTAGYDNIGYHSLDCCNDMYKDMKEFVSGIPDRPVYGIGLGDIVHRDLSLLPQHKSGMASTGIRNYNVIGNHDHDVSKTTDDRDAARPFEAVLGPANYSLNLGDLHIVVLDNMIAPLVDGIISDDCNDGLTDDIWQWLQNDLAFVPSNRTIMVCAHSPMFRLIGGKDRTAKHSADYKRLLSSFEKVHAWAGHNHCSLNYVNTADPRIESHIVTRVTGDLWTNEYLGSNGTPRGYVFFDYSNGKYTWRFKPIFYQTGAFTGTYGGGGKKPDYVYREWDYDATGKAVMRNGGNALDGDYQMQVFAPGTYGDSYLYVNVFLWDELWDVPKFIMGSVPRKMTRVVAPSGGDPDCRYSCANREIKEFYKTNNSHLATASYGFTPSNTESMFRVFVDSEHGSGTVSVRDRFGNIYSSSVSW